MCFHCATTRVREEAEESALQEEEAHKKAKKTYRPSAV